MKVTGLYLLFLLTALTATAQVIITPQKPTTYPVFTTPEDSSNYARVIQALTNLRFKGSDKFTRAYSDSLMGAMGAAYRKSTGTKNAYLPHTSFTPWDSVLKKNLFDSVTMVSFSSRRFTELPAELWKCKNIEAIEIFETRITQLPENMHTLGKLHTLLITQATPITLAPNTALRTLIARKRIPQNLSALPYLTKLDLSDCNLTRFPKGLRKNRTLKELMLNDNPINLAKGKAPRRNNIQHVEIRNAGITQLPASVRRLKQVKTLVVNNNKISKIASGIKRLKKLEQLGLYKNQLTEIPKGIYALAALREIDLYYNQIEVVDDRLGKLKNLEVLYLSYNKLSKVSEAIGTLHKLEEVYLSENMLTEIPASLSDLTNLRVLRINNNLISNQINDLHKLTQLEDLDISENRFAEAPQGIGTLNQLKLLVINDNPWNESSRQLLATLSKNLRGRNVVVHFEEDSADAH